MNPGMMSQGTPQMMAMPQMAMGVPQQQGQQPQGQPQGQQQPMMNPMMMQMGMGQMNMMAMNPMLMQQYQLMQQQQMMMLNNARMLQQQQQQQQMMMLNNARMLQQQQQQQQPQQMAMVAGRGQVQLVAAGQQVLPNGQVVVHAVPAGRGVARYVAVNRNGVRVAVPGVPAGYRVVSAGGAAGAAGAPAAGQIVMTPQGARMVVRGPPRAFVVRQQPAPGGRGTVLQNYQRMVQAIRVPPGYTVRKTPDGRLFFCPPAGKRAVAVTARGAGAAGTGTAAGTTGAVTKASEDELVPLPANKQDKGELKEWDRAWVKAVKGLRAREQEPTVAMMLAHLRCVQACEKHALCEPLGRVLAESRAQARAAAEEGADGGSAERFLEVVQGAVEALYAALLKHYSALRDEPYDTWASDSLYELLFQTLYDTVYPTYTRRFRKDDDDFVALCREFADITPAHLGLARKFWLTDQATVPAATPLAQVPYGSAVAALADIDRMRSHMAKVQVLVESAHRIYTSVERYWDGKPDKPDKLEIAADEFLPLFAYVIIRSHIASPSSTLAYINDFMTEQECAGEAGYYFATFQSAFAYVQTLTKDDIAQAYAEAWGNPKPYPKSTPAPESTSASNSASTPAGDEFMDMDALNAALLDFGVGAPDSAAPTAQDADQTPPSPSPPPPPPPPLEEAPLPPPVPPTAGTPRAQLQQSPTIKLPPFVQASGRVPPPSVAGTPPPPALSLQATPSVPRPNSPRYSTLTPPSMPPSS